MKRVAGLLWVIAAVGCKPPAPDPPPAEPPATAPVIDFAGWPAVTDKPYRVDPAIAGMCVPPPPEWKQFEAEHAAKREAEKKPHGPHYWPSIVVRVSPDGVDAFRAGRPLPVGATVVKEKHRSTNASLPPEEYAAMVKREPGYDPVNGDWEYVYVNRKKDVARGRLESCIDCHANAKNNDYLFRPYLPPRP